MIVGGVLMGGTRQINGRFWRINDSYMVDYQVHRECKCMDESNDASLPWTNFYIGGING